MKIFLPSNGMMGKASITMRAPKIGDLREVPNFSQSSIIRKTQFVELLTGSDVRQLSPSDRDYLFILAVGSISMNRVILSVQCDCGNPIFEEISIGELEPIRLRRGVSSIVRKKIFNTLYDFHKLTVQDEINIEERAVDLPDEDYLDEFNDGIVAKTLGYDLTEKSILRVRSLDLSIYYAALLYQSVDVHGVTLVKECICNKCGKSIKAHLPIEGSILNVDVSQIMQRFVSLRPYISMESYFNITLPEYNTFIDALNAKLK